MRRVGVVLVAALAATGCGVRTETVPGPAAPITATGPAPAPSPSGSGSTSPSGSPSPSPSTAALRSMSMTGFGLRITFPVPADWTVVNSGVDGRSTTDATLGNDVLLRVDLTARGPGTTRAGAVSTEASIRPHRPNYRRLGIADVAGVGDEAVDWTFTHDQDGTPSRVIDRQIMSGPGGVAVYLRAPAESYARYLPVWQRATRDLVIRPS